MLSGYDIICLSSIDWDFIWQGHQEIMTALAKAGNRVLFIENTGVRAPNLKDLPRLRQRLRNRARGVQGFRQVGPGLFVYAPVIFPFPYARPARWINRRLLLGAIQRWMRAMGFGRPIVWSFLPTPLAVDVIRMLDPLLTVYYCIDDFASSSPQARRIVQSENTLFREADLVFVTSEKLRQRALRCTRRAYLFPFGVSFERFQSVLAQQTAMPEDLRGIRHPVVGYVGGVHQWVDQRLLAEAAQRMPQISFVLVGPEQTDISALRRHANIHLLGRKPHEQLPHYIRHFDVGVVPYRLSEYTAHVYPTKLNEYLAMGIPVVATDLPEIRRFNAEHGPVVNIASDSAAFVEALSQAQRDGSPGDVSQRIAVARSNSWSARVEQMSRLIADAIAQRKAQPSSWEEALRRLYRRAHRKVAGPALLALCLWGLVFHTPLLWLAARPLRVAGVVAPADAIVVFAGGVGESGKAGQGYEERVQYAARLYQQGLAPTLIFSSGYLYAIEEAEVMQALAVSLGVPASAIILEPEAANTHQNVLFTARIMRSRGWRSALVVSSPYHMRRVTMVYRKVAPELEVIAAPIPKSQFFGDEQRVEMRHVAAVLHEYLGIAFYYLKGYVG